MRATLAFNGLKTNYPLCFVVNIIGNFQSTMDVEDSFATPTKLIQINFVTRNFLVFNSMVSGNCSIIKKECHLC